METRSIFVKEYLRKGIYLIGNIGIKEALEEALNVECFGIGVRSLSLSLTYEMQPLESTIAARSDAGCSRRGIPINDNSWEGSFLCCRRWWSTLLLLETHQGHSQYSHILCFDIMPSVRRPTILLILTAVSSSQMRMRLCPTTRTFFPVCVRIEEMFRYPHAVHSIHKLCSND